MKNQDIWTEVQDKLRQIKAEEPYWPEHVASQVAMVCQEPSKMLSLAIDQKYHGRDQHEAMRTTAIRTIAWNIRFLEAMKK